MIVDYRTPNRLPSQAALLALSRLAARAVMAISLLALMGWVLSIQTLTTLFPLKHSRMNPLAAIGFLLAAVSLDLQISGVPTSRKWRWMARGCAITLLVIGILKLVSDDFSISISVDRLFFPDTTRTPPISPNTAGALVTLGMALLLLDYRTPRGRRLAVPLALATVAVALLALTGYAYSIEQLSGFGALRPMALTSAISFLLLSLAILTCRPQHNPLATVLSDSAGGVVARRLLPAAVILPLVIGWICLVGIQHNLYKSAFGLTLYSLLITLIFVALTWWNVRSLHRLDIERRRAERDVAEERHLLRALIDTLPDLVFVKDRQSRFLLTNWALARGLGAPDPETMRGKSDTDYFPPEKALAYRADEIEIIETGVPVIDKEQYFIDKSDAAHWLTVTKVPLADTEGQIIGTVGIAHDVTLRKQAEEERDRFFTLSADMMCMAGFDGYFKRVNPAFETTLGYTPDETLSRPWLEFVHPDDQEATIAEGKKLALGAVTLYFENRYRCKDGSYRWLSWTAVPVVRDQRIYAVARDTTERRRVEEQLRLTNQKLEQAVDSERQAQASLRAAQSTLVHTEKMAGLGQMVAGVAHEINNPLSFVSNNVAVLQRDLRGVIRLLELYVTADAALEQHQPQLLADIQEVARKMDLTYVLGNLQELLMRSRDGLKRIQQIVKDLRDFARLDESDLQDVKLNESLLSTITIVRGHAKKNGVEIRTDLADLPLVTCYPAKVNQVVMNLLTNAIDATAPGGNVTLRTRADDGQYVLIEVADSGSGIDPAIQKRIFDPFFTTKPQGQGTGLGLSISYGIVRDHAGMITVRSEPGKGSVFTVKLPIHGPAREKPPAVALVSDAPVA